LTVWGGFSAAATALQWLLEQLGLLSGMMAATSYWLGGAILLLAGLGSSPRSRALACGNAARR
jgi:predicted metal-binding membrane protein